ncbi:hypothetical protein J4E90_002882 [Alternaria incomplexa]|uniref:uncharacterized protein n=1 Tax=Alternaria incomplexa TaxID=1187928 RepID=UPI002220335F|nr:uncharacterized protein J4E90_002882 [Alternaria incomplexa]KAI4918498.1 hypothetical protein J4E90_002882 [Alternaria incomplexa]
MLPPGARQQGFSSIMRAEFNPEVTTPFGDDGRQQQVRRRRVNNETPAARVQRRAAAKATAPAAAPVTQNPGPVQLGPESQAIALAGQSSLMGSSQSSAGRSSAQRSSSLPVPPDYTPAPSRAGPSGVVINPGFAQFPRGGRAGRSGRDGRGRRDGRSGRGGREAPSLHQTPSADEDELDAETSAGQDATPGSRRSTVGAVVGVQGVHVDSHATPREVESHRDTTPDSRPTGERRRGKTPVFTSDGLPVLQGEGVGLALDDLPEGAMGSSPPRLSQADRPGSIAGQHLAGEELEESEEEAEQMSDEESSSVHEAACLVATPNYAALWNSGRHKSSRFALVARAFIHARELGWTTMDETDFKQTGTSILCSIPGRHVLPDLLDGNLAARDMREGDRSLFSADSSWMDRSTTDAPCVYVEMMVAVADGGHISRRRLSHIVELLRQYTTVPRIEDTEAIDNAVAIDNAFKKTGKKTERKHIRAGRHKFLWKPGQGGALGVRRVTRVDIVRSFCDALEKRVGRAINTLPLQYFGNTLNFSKREKEHTRDEHSSFLMQLIRHVCEALWPGECCMKAYPVFFACDAGESRLGEILLTLLGHGLAALGTGMNIHQPGINNATADMNDWRNEDAVKLWRDCTNFRDKEGSFDANFAVERALLSRDANPGEGNADEEELAEMLRQIAEEEKALSDMVGEGLRDNLNDERDKRNAEIDAIEAEHGEAVAEFMAVLRRRGEEDEVMVEETWEDWTARVKGYL